MNTVYASPESCSPVRLIWVPVASSMAGIFDQLGLRVLAALQDYDEGGAVGSGGY